MRTTWLNVVAVSVAVLLSQATMHAHHSFAAEFDAKKAATLTGTVVRLDWTNPHAHIHVDVKDADGKVTLVGLRTGEPERVDPTRLVEEPR